MNKYNKKCATMLSILLFVMLIFGFTVIGSRFKYSKWAESFASEITSEITSENTQESTHENTLNINSDNPGSFCEQTETNTIFNIDKKCTKLSKETCNVTSCCVWNDETNCQGGNEKGPTFKNTNSKNYYFKNKCYGDCPNII